MPCLQRLTLDVYHRMLMWTPSHTQCISAVAGVPGRGPLRFAETDPAPSVAVCIHQAHIRSKLRPLVNLMECNGHFTLTLRDCDHQPPEIP